jgi:hypothetical protein
MRAPGRRQRRSFARGEKGFVINASGRPERESFARSEKVAR